MTKLMLVLAHGPDQPEGDTTDRLTLELALTSQGHIDSSRYDVAPTPWLAACQRNGAPPHMLEVVRIDDGWALQSTDSLDDPLWAFDGEVWRPGELVRFRRPDGAELLYRIVAAEQS